MKLADWLKSSNTTVTGFADKLGISTVMVYGVLNGKKRFGGDLILAVKKITRGKVGADDLIGPLSVPRKGRTRGKAA